MAALVDGRRPSSARGPRSCEAAVRHRLLAPPPALTPLSSRQTMQRRQIVFRGGCRCKMGWGAPQAARRPCSRLPVVMAGALWWRSASLLWELPPLLPPPEGTPFAALPRRARSPGPPRPGLTGLRRRRPSSSVLRRCRSNASSSVLTRACQRRRGPDPATLEIAILLQEAYRDR